MTTVGDQSWMYMMPRKPKPRVVDLPPISQVPGIGNASDEYFEKEFRNAGHKPGHIIAKPTDSDYIILCKKGGRTDLLTHRAFVPENKDPVPYERCDWFYQLDRDLEKEEETQKHIPNLPSYMMHKEFQPSKLLPDEVKLKEIKKKTVKKVVVSTPYDVCAYSDWYRSFPRRKCFKSKRFVREFHDPYKSLLQIPHLEDDDDGRIDMGKLMANTYQKEWDEKREKWAASFEAVNRHNVEVMKKINEKELCKKSKPFDRIAWLRKSIFSSICNQTEQRKRESMYQTAYTKSGFKSASLMTPVPKHLPQAFPKFPEDNSPIDFTKLIAHQYGKEYEKKAEEFKKDILKYVGNLPKERKPVRSKSSRMLK